MVTVCILPSAFEKSCPFPSWSHLPSTTPFIEIFSVPHPLTCCAVAKHALSVALSPTLGKEAFRIPQPPTSACSWSTSSSFHLQILLKQNIYKIFNWKTSSDSFPYPLDTTLTAWYSVADNNVLPTAWNHPQLPTKQLDYHTFSLSSLSRTRFLHVSTQFLNKRKNKQTNTNKTKQNTRYSLGRSTLAQRDAARL